MQEEIAALGFRVLAIAPDLPAKVLETEKKLGLSFPIYSDTSAEVITSFGLGFVQNDSRYAKLLESSSGMDHHILPIPAVVIVDAEKEIQFLHADPRYQMRLPAAVLSSAARAWAPAAEE